MAERPRLLTFSAYNSTVSSGEVESFLNDRGQFSNATSFLTQNRLGTSGTDDDLGSNGCHTNFDTRVTILGEFTGQEFIELGEEDTVGNKLNFYKMD